jgi:3-phenylpropionate/trans-cinnamate dioxygenase ferredoxin reductase subunit
MAFVQGVAGDSSSSTCKEECMSEAAGSANGPDLRQGIAVAKLDDGAVLRGHVAQTPALLVLRGADVLAIGATCTHYGGPLAEGLVVGDTVRCPWHHACFSLRTGAALRPPALNDLPCWCVEQRDGMAFVREELQRPAPPSRPAAGLPTSVVIVGGGTAGLAAAEALRTEGYASAVTLMSADPSPRCDRPNLSKDYLAGTAETDWIPLLRPEFDPKHHIDLRLGTRVTAIEPGAHAVLLADGSRMTYGAPLLATGAEPIKLGIPGASLPHVHVLRTIADSNALIARAYCATLCGCGGEFHRPGGRRLATHPRAGGTRDRARSASHGACHGRGNRRHGARDP